MGFWETAAKVGKGALKVGVGMAQSFGERVEREVEQYNKERDYVSGKSDAVLLSQIKYASGNSAKTRALVDELKSRGYTSEDFAKIRSGR